VHIQGNPESTELLPGFVEPALRRLLGIAGVELVRRNPEKRGVSGSGRVRRSRLAGLCGGGGGRGGRLSLQEGVDGAGFGQVGVEGIEQRG
jgi:hypothetical protein